MKYLITKQLILTRLAWKRKNLSKFKHIKSSQPSHYPKSNLLIKSPSILVSLCTMNNFPLRMTNPHTFLKLGAYNWITSLIITNFRLLQKLNYLMSYWSITVRSSSVMSPKRTKNNSKPLGTIVSTTQLL